LADTLAHRDSGGLSTALAAAALRIEAALGELIGEPVGPGARLIEAMRYASLNGGKRLRGFLVMETARLFGVAEWVSARVAASVEMLHAYSLVHDDLPAMDDDDLRRGQPSTHRKFDEATAILAGDALQTRAFEVLAEVDTHPDPAVRCDLVKELGSAAGAWGMAGGQMIDMLGEGRSLSLEEIAELHALKTGRLITYSAAAGAILGRASSEQRQRIARYGADLGTAFQIADDVLDASGDTATIGKTAGKDAASGKATYVTLLGIERAAEQARALSDRAISHLDAFGGEAGHLRDLARFVVERSN
jgi:farnesyl diphosphate synthase